MKRPAKSPLLIDILAPDPFDAGALLAPAVEAYRARTGVSLSAVARLAGVAQPVLWRALRNPDARPATVRAVCRALGLEVCLRPIAGPTKQGER